ncbi:CMRF35-like molecule 1 [Mauremys mutica]|uniref:CMRF35-like molecule 1 n=1 Tax=Mauremys mutica TaxID=74926 RepID=UPI001D16038A|nr:CMRF35-like molecule 1 [Mauremys mutica]
MRIFPILGWMLFPGCWAVTGPGPVCAPPGGSVAVQCRYRAGYEHYQKFWCRAGSLFCSDGRHIVETNGSEAEVTRGRVSIRDNRTQRAFTVTVENLTPADAGTYHCGVGRPGLLDLRATVELTISPGKSRRGSYRYRGGRGPQPGRPASGALDTQSLWAPRGCSAGHMCAGGHRGAALESPV